MRKFCILIQLLTALTIRPAFAQEEEWLQAPSEAMAEESAELAPDEEDDTPIPGIAASGSTQVAQQDMATVKNWIFVGGALVAAAVGVIVVATNTGSGSDHD